MILVHFLRSELKKQNKWFTQNEENYTIRNEIYAHRSCELKNTEKWFTQNSRMRRAHTKVCFNKPVTHMIKKGVRTDEIAV